MSVNVTWLYLLSLHAVTWQLLYFILCKQSRKWISKWCYRLERIARSGPNFLQLRVDSFRLACNLYVLLSAAKSKIEIILGLHKAGTTAANHEILSKDTVNVKLAVGNWGRIWHWCLTGRVFCCRFWSWRCRASSTRWCHAFRWGWQRQCPSDYCIWHRSRTCLGWSSHLCRNNNILFDWFYFVVSPRHILAAWFLLNYFYFAFLS